MSLSNTSHQRRKPVLKLFQDAYFRLTGDDGDFVFDETDTKQAEHLIKAFLGPNPSFEYYSFPQHWPSASLGFGGLGAQAQTTANTSVFVDLQGEHSKALVYFRQQFAYETKLTPAFWQALDKRSMPAVAQRMRLKLVEEVEE